MLKRNVANWDRATRFVVSMIAFYPVFIDPGLMASWIAKGILLVFGLANATAFLTGYCLVYHLTRFTTLRDNSDTHR